MKHTVRVVDGIYCVVAELSNTRACFSKYELEQMINSKELIGSDTQQERMYLRILNRLECGRDECR